MIGRNAVYPTFSHGGTSGTKEFPPITGNSGNLTAGNPISVIGSVQAWNMRPCIVLYASGTSGSCVVAIEANGGTVDTVTFRPPSGEWVDTTNGGITLAFGEKTAKKVMLSMPYWRTRLISCSGDIVLVSYVPHIHVYQNGCVHWATAGYPIINSDATYGM